MIDFNTLNEMLTYCRPHGSDEVAQFVDRFIMSDPTASVDEFGNIVIIVGADRSLHRNERSDDLPRTLFTSHVDSVHRLGGRQTISVDTNGVISLSKDSVESNCLGADDASGVWLMLAMIECGVEGVYIFHQGEERGGLGSRFIASHYPKFLSSFDRAIAFDRHGTGDVITHQATGRCCSDAFAEQLSKELGGEYAPCDAGVYTDTAEYTHIIPECTNISVGYEREHSTSETQCTTHLIALLVHLVRIDFDKLPTNRNPSSVEPTSDYWDMSGQYMADIYANESLDQLIGKMDEDLAYDIVDNDPDTAVALLMLLTGRS